MLLAFAPAPETIKCKADQPVEGGASIEFAAQVLENGAALVPDPAVFLGTPVAAVWRKAGRHESQATFTMIMGKVTSTIYDFSIDGHTGPVNVLTADDIRFQCWVE